MDDLIEALIIFKNYLKKDDYNYKYPTHCEHDVLTVCVNPENVSQEDKDRLEKLGFITNKDKEVFISFKFGSC